MQNDQSSHNQSVDGAKPVFPVCELMVGSVP
jgi:hypothetical protein